MEVQDGEVEKGEEVGEDIDKIILFLTTQIIQILILKVNYPNY